MKTIRVFVSSPGDVRTERTIAERLIRTTAEELGIPVSVQYSNLLRDPQSQDSPNSSIEPEFSELILCPYFWEYQRFSPELGYQDQIPNTAQFDLVVCILWSRLGTKLHPRFQMPDRSEPRSGTDYEIAWALAQRKQTPGVPALHVYRNCSQPNPPLDSPEGLEEFLRQWKSLKTFFDSRLIDDAGQFVGAFNNYYNLEEFERLFREHFRDFLSTRVSSERQRLLISQRSRSRRWKENPFRGLEIFDFEHAPIFHGRTGAIGAILEAFEAQVRVQRPFVLVVGASGSGKSSLVRAGVLPLLTQPETVEGIGLWRRTVTRPGGGGSEGDCFDALAAALLEPTALPALKDAESLSAIRDLATELREHSNSVALRVRDALDHAAREWKTQHSHYLEERERQLRGSGRSDDAELARQQRERLELPKSRLALVVDQLEELFTTGFSAEVRQNYISAIADLVRSGRVFIVATLRSDFYPWYQQFSDLIELTKPGGKVDLRPPTAYEIGNMIRLPAEAAGLQFEQEPETGQGLDQALRDAAAATPESLPLLEHVLSLLYDEQRARGDDLLRWSDYRELGELKGALAKHAEAVFNTLQPQEQMAFSLVMRYLVTLGHGEEEVPNRRTVPYRDFVASGETDQEQKAGARGFVNLFVEKRLFVADTDPHGQVTVSVAHEALLREWQRVKEWLKENREFLRMRDRLDSSMKLWLGRRKQKDDLLGPGLPLAEGEKLVSDFEPSLSREQVEYVRASITEQNRRKHTRERIRYAVMAGITAALVVAVIFALMSFRQYRRAERATVVANQAAERATLARNQAEKLINFMTIALRDKLKPIGKLDLLNDVNQMVQDYYKSLGGDDASPEIQRQHSIALVNYGDVLLDQGAPAEALKLYQQALEIRRKLINLDQNNPLYQADLAVSLQQIGNVFETRGDIGKALGCYQEARDIREKLIKQSPQNIAWQSQWARSLEKVGLILQAQGDLSGALKNYRAGLDFATKLKELDPKSTALQSEIWLLNVRVGEALDAKMDPDEALKCYRQSLSIAQGLNIQEPDDAEWQRDIGVSQEQIGEILSAQGDLRGALDSYKNSFDVRNKLFARDPTDALWENDLALSYEDLGNILDAQGDLGGALKMYRESLSLRTTLAKRDESNAEAQRSLEISNAEIGSLLLSLGDFPGASESCTDALQIAHQLAEKDQNNQEWQSNLSEVSERAADVLKAQGSFSEALEMYKNAMSIRTSLNRRDARWQMEVAKNEQEIAEILISERDYQKASELCRSAAKRGELLAAQYQNNTDVRSNLAASYEKFGEALLGERKPDEALINLRNSLQIFDRLSREHPDHAAWESGMAFTCLQIAYAVRLTPAAEQLEIRIYLTQARDILLRKKRRFTLGVVDEGRLNAVDNALRDL
jgi:eukaryotic-like serine/threonine-protein kinase